MKQSGGPRFCRQQNFRKQSAGPVVVSGRSLSGVFRVLVGSAACAAVVAWPGQASAGPWFEGRAGAGVTSGHFEWEDQYIDAETGERAIAHDEGGPFGIAFGLGAVGGYAVNQQTALGITGRIEIAPYLEDANPRYASVDLHLLWALGSTFAFRPARSFELRVTPEWAFASFAGSTQDIGADDNVFAFEDVSGPGLGFSLGYQSAPGWGFSTAANVVVLSGEHTKLTMLTLTLLASYSTW